MADRIAVMAGGVLQAFDPPEDLYDRPKTLFVAGFVGNPPMNFVEVEVSQAEGEFRARSDAVDISIPADRGAPAAAYEGKVIMGIRPEDVNLRDEVDTMSGGQEVAGVTGKAVVVEPLGREDLVMVDIAGAEVRILVDKLRGIRVGDNLELAVNTAKVQFFDPATEKSLLWS
jgi:ABC-type sugar transport system ATPase subunit